MANSKLELQKKPTTTKNKQTKNTRLHVYSKSQKANQNKSLLNLSLNRKKQRLASKESCKYLVQTNKQKQLGIAWVWTTKNENNVDMS